LRRRAGALRERQAQKKDTCGQFRTESKAASGEAGESQGVVRAPWRTHLPAVRAVWVFHAGVVERAKIAPLGSEAQIITLFQGKQRGHTQNWREISMANRKIKFPLWLMPETKATVERLYRQDGCSSQSEFMERAILFYCGYLQSEYAGDFLPKILGETLEAILSMFGDRIGRLLFKQTVELDMGLSLLAECVNLDESVLRKQRAKSVNDVKRTNGQLRLEQKLRTQDPFDEWPD
jgi:hypothetical protein